MLKNTENLFGSDWFQKFNLWDQSINTFCQKVECITAKAEKIKMELKGSFPEVFSTGLGKCTKIKAKCELKENTRPIFRKKRNVPFAATGKIDQEQLQKQNKLRKTTLVPKKRFNPGEKIYFKKYQNNTSCWERGIIKKRIGDMMYIVEGPKYTHKRHQN